MKIHLEGDICAALHGIKFLALIWDISEITYPLDKSLQSAFERNFCKIEQLVQTAKDISLFSRTGNDDIMQTLLSPLSSGGYWTKEAVELDIALDVVEAGSGYSPYKSTEELYSNMDLAYENLLSRLIRRMISNRILALHKGQVAGALGLCEALKSFFMTLNELLPKAKREQPRALIVRYCLQWLNSTERHNWLARHPEELDVIVQVSSELEECLG